MQPNGRVFKKQVYGNYHWETFAEVDERIDAFGFGLLALGHQTGSSLVIYAETRAEWMIAAQVLVEPCFFLRVTSQDDVVLRHTLPVFTGLGRCPIVNWDFAGAVSILCNFTRNSV